MVSPFYEHPDVNLPREAFIEASLMNKDWVADPKWAKLGEYLPGQIKDGSLEAEAVKLLNNETFTGPDLNGKIVGDNVKHLMSFGFMFLAVSGRLTEERVKSLEKANILDDPNKTLPVRVKNAPAQPFITRLKDWLLSREAQYCEENKLAYSNGKTSVFINTLSKAICDTPAFKAK